MTRNNRAKSSNTTSPSPTAMKDTFIDLPDLSKFRDEEKRHILNVLERDENLRNQHLLRFMHLRKEVTDLEQQPHPSSASVCARCQTPFGFIFNTGDDCPKCGAKVCKQCRLLHNDHDNGWLCQLCCKQMQLMSYSGEWLYTASNKPKKNFETSWDAKREIYHKSVSARNSNIESSSDSEPEILNVVSNPVSRFASLAPPTKESKSKPTGSNSKINKMLVQSEIDQQKLDFVRDHLRRRPKDTSFTQPLPRRAIKLPSTSNTVHSSVEEVNSIQSAQVPTPKKQNLAVPKEVIAVASLPNETLKEPSKNEEIDRKSIVSTENVDPPKKSKRHRLKLHVSRQQSTNDSKLSLESITTEKSSHKNLSASMQNLRDTVHRITPSQLLSSRNASSSRRDHLSVSSNMPSGKDDEDTISVKTSETTNKTNVPTKSESLQIPTGASKQSTTIKRQESSPVVPSNKSTEPKPKSNLLSATYSAAPPTVVRGREDRLKSVESRDEPRNNRTASVGTRTSAGDSDEDNDKNFRQVKLDKTKRTSSFMSLRGSQLSLNSGISDSKANYELDITGTIEIRLSYNIKSSSLEILINKCTNLARAKRNQTSNPYCKCYLLPDQSKSSKQKTSIKKHTTDPVFAETLRYRVSSDEFSSRILWISVWSQSSIGHNDFLGEIHIPLAHCTLDKVEEHTLLSRMSNDDAASNAGTAGDSNVLQFNLTFLENRLDKETGTIQINEIQGIGIYYGKHPVDAICKGVLMPGKLKRKLPTVRKGPTPKWDIPLRWENIRRKDLPNTSLEISIWCQERFRKPMIGSIQLHSTSAPSDSKVAKGSSTLKTEISVWETFLKDPTTVHHCRLPLRSTTQEK